METITKQEVSQRTMYYLQKLKLDLNEFEDLDLLNADQASDFFSDALHSIGKDYDWWCEQ